MHRLKLLPCLLLIVSLGLFHNVAQCQIQKIRQEIQKLSFIKDDVSKVNSLNRLGTLYSTRNIDSSFYYGIKAKRIATDLYYLKGQTDADNVIAYALFKKGLYAESLELYSKVLSSYQNLSDTVNIVRVYMDMANVLHKGISDQSEINALMQKAIQTGKQLNKDSIMSAVYASYCSFISGLPADSINYYMSKSKEIASRYKDEYMLALNQVWQAYLLNEKGQKQEALSLVRQALSYAQHTGNVNLETSALFVLVGHYYRDNPQKALEYCNQVYELARKNGDRELEVYILDYVLDLTKQSGNKDEIINAHIALEEAMIADRENMKKFIGDYVKYNAIENDNKLLSQKNAQRALWLVIIVAAASIIILAIYLIMLNRTRKAKAQIDTLNNIANMHVTSMEEIKEQATREEQKRLGRDLHDNLSSTLAGVKHRIDAIAQTNKHTEIGQQLIQVSHHIEEAYAIARGKSHQWYQDSSTQQETAFENRIQQLLDSVLPDGLYHKEVHIDPGTLKNVPIETRIEFLRIIQEAVTNTIKYAKAHRFSVLIYQENNTLTLTISDDGKGMGMLSGKRNKIKAGIGISSMRDRARNLQGTMEIKSSTKGTEIIVSIPMDKVID